MCVLHHIIRTLVTPTVRPQSLCSICFRILWTQQTHTSQLKAMVCMCALVLT